MSSADPVQGQPEQPSFVRLALSIARYHIMAIGMTACVVFSWLMTDRYNFGLVAVVGIDWFLINLLNRITDIEEDRRNGIEGTETVARQATMLMVLAAVIFVGSFGLSHYVAPELTAYRVVVQAIGVAYNYKVIPARKGWTRLKELYFWKNFGSSLLFVLTCFVYPLALSGMNPVMSWGGVMCLVLFFVPFELTYEILYDFRDLEGDKALGVPTYPVVHGSVVARRIIDGLLVGSAVVLAFGLVAGWLGMREALMLAAPAIQFMFYRGRLARGLTPRDCILMTHLGTGLLWLYLCGTALWLRAGLPANIYL